MFKFKFKKKVGYRQSSLIPGSFFILLFTMIFIDDFKSSHNCAIENENNINVETK